MYKQFYGLRRNPFEATPDPYFFYPTPRHNEVLANLYYGVQRQKGFVVVAGEVGTGKTLLVRRLLDTLNRSRIAFAYVFNTRLSDLEFLRYVLTDFGLSISGGTSKGEMIRRLNEFLINRSRLGLTSALIIDEAQLLEWDVLEEVRLLTNLETAQHKLLQIVLVGQPELDQKLDLPNLRQLKQRIALHCNLQPLREDETHGYIHRRLELAGANSHASEIFPETTIARIHHYSRGIPRLINHVCDGLLISGYARQSRRILAEMVEETAKDLRLDLHPDLPASQPSVPAEALGEMAKLMRMFLGMLQSGNSGNPPRDLPRQVGLGVKNEPTI